MSESPEYPLPSRRFVVGYEDVNIHGIKVRRVVASGFEYEKDAKVFAESYRRDERGNRNATVWELRYVR